MLQITNTTRNRDGFSLVELSIVLVILGLLVGGVLSGQSLIRASELRAVISEFQRYQTAEQTFRDKYFALPGDMSNATAFWGYTGGTGCTNSSGTGSSSPGTCDGNADGLLTYGPNLGQSGETFQAWRQLALAGIIEGSYNGMANGTSQDATGADGFTPGVNCPRSKIGGNVCWALSYWDATLLATSWPFARNYINWMSIGGTNDVFADDAFLKPEEAWNIDSKMDDGKPGTGSIQANVLCSSASSNTDFSATYLLQTSTITCALFFKSL